MMKTRKRGAFKISRTLLEIYLDCPRKWYYYSHPDIPKKTDYKRLCCIAVHKHISQLYRPTSTARPLFYKDKKSVIGAWFNRWHRELDKARELNRIVQNAELTKEYGKIGAICVANYFLMFKSKQGCLKKDTLLIPIFSNSLTRLFLFCII